MGEENRYANPKMGLRHCHSQFKNLCHWWGPVGGGALGTESTNTVEEYNTRTDTWTRKADLWLDLSGLSGGFVNNGKIYVVGGHKKRGEEHNGRGIKKFSWTVYKSLSAYDIATDTWEQLENMPTERWAFGASVMDGKLYVIGGATGNLFPLTTITESLHARWLAIPGYLLSLL